MSSRETGFYNWADDAVVAEVLAPQNLPAPYAAPGVPAVVPPIPGVVQPAFGAPYYDHRPAEQAPYDRLPARMYACGVLAFGVLAGSGICGVGVGYGCDLAFTGMARATDAIIGLAVAVVAGVVGIVVVALVMGGTRISVRQGSNSSYHSGR